MLHWLHLFVSLVAYTGLNAQGLNLQPLSLGNQGDDDCICVKYYQCTSNGTINTSGAGIVGVRQDEKVCKDIGEICCVLEDIKSAQVVPLSLPQPISPTDPQSIDDIDDILAQVPSISPPIKPTKLPQPPPTTFPPLLTNLMETVTTVPRVEPLLRGCGVRSMGRIGVRVKGEDTEFGEFPWMVAILNGTQYKCGGALIHPQVVITAAHCVFNGTKYTVRAGEWDTRHNDEQFAHQTKEVESITIHPQFYDGALFNDIAFLVLNSPVEPAGNIGFICLPPQDSRMNAGRCISTGWGKDVFGSEGKHQTILKKVDLPLVPRDICQSQLRETRLGKYFQLHRSFICAGGELGKDTCTGDGGSPLVCPIEGEPNRLYHAGIVAWGIGCGDADVPGVYADVAYFRDWVDEQMQLNGFNTSSYTY